MEVATKGEYNTTELNKLRGLGPRTNYTDRATALVGKVSTNFCG
jgi:hypothetical protein